MREAKELSQPTELYFAQPLEVNNEFGSVKFIGNTEGIWV